MNEPFLTIQSGWTGIFTRRQEGPIPNGTRIVKGEGEPGDAHPPGTLGTVLGSLKATDDVNREARAKGLRECDCFYFVEWDPLPRHAVALADWKIRRADGE